MISLHGWDSTIIFWGAIVLIVVITNYFSHKNLESRHRMMETLAQQGQPIPPELFVSSNRDRYRYHSPIQSGIFLMCIGIALALFFWAATGGGDYFNGERMPSWLPFIGIFPFMVGLARFLGGFFDRPRDK